MLLPKSPSSSSSCERRRHDKELLIRVDSREEEEEKQDNSAASSSPPFNLERLLTFYRPKQKSYEKSLLLSMMTRHPLMLLSQLASYDDSWLIPGAAVSSIIILLLPRVLICDPAAPAYDPDTAGLVSSAVRICR